MFEVKERPRMVERALLIGVFSHKYEELLATNLIEELRELVTTLGIAVEGEELVRVPKFEARLLLGSGRADEVLELAREVKADVIVFDNELSPAQQRNWESMAGITVIDRQEVILDIFGRRAMTSEAKLQVELARLEYQLPRLTRAWTHLGRQGGSGGAARGEGEQQIEVDRRMLRRKIDQVKREIKHVKTTRATQRKSRQRVPVPNAAIVGYTNAGKSSLLRQLTGAKVLVADKLFATLDTTTRRIELPNGHPLLLTDTVGFVRKLPHGLVDAFKATLEEAVLADFLVHVVDVSHPEVESFYKTTLEVLKELGADEKRVVTVFNKIDLLNDPSALPSIHLNHPDALFVSAETGEGIEALCNTMADMLADKMVQVDLEIPHDRSDLVASVHEQGKVFETRYEDSHVALHALVPHRLHGQLMAFAKS